MVEGGINNWTTPKWILTKPQGIQVQHIEWVSSSLCPCPSGMNWEAAFGHSMFGSFVWWCTAGSDVHRMCSIWRFLQLLLLAPMAAPGCLFPQCSSLAAAAISWCPSTPRTPPNGGEKKAGMHDCIWACRRHSWGSSRTRQTNRKCRYRQNESTRIARRMGMEWTTKSFTHWAKYK